MLFSPFKIDSLFCEKESMECSTIAGLTKATRRGTLELEIGSHILSKVLLFL